MCCTVMPYVAVCCSVLQCVAVCCSVLPCVAVCCSVLQCELCAVNTSRLDDILKFPNAVDALKRGGVCTKCPANTAAGLMSTKVHDCVCNRGYSFVSNACVTCPANTYKDTPSNVDRCIFCSIGFQSRGGSNDISKCLKLISMGQY